MTSLSNLIKKGKHSGLKIETFRVQEFESGSLPSGQKGAPSDRSTGTIEDRLSRIEMEAYEKGFQQGQRDGLALGKKRLDEASKRLEALIKSISELKAKIFKESEKEILTLTMEIARKIIRKELETDPEAVLRTIRRAIDHVNDRSVIRIQLNSADMEKVRDALPELRSQKKIKSVELMENVAVERGGCFVETGFGIINGTIEDQLAAISEELDEELNTNGKQNATSTQEVY